MTSAGIGGGVVLPLSTSYASLAWTQTPRAALVTRSRAKPGRRLTAESQDQCSWQAYHLRLAAVGPREAAHAKLPALGTREGWW